MADTVKLIKKADDSIERRNYDMAIECYILALEKDLTNIDARSKLRAAQIRCFAEKGISPTMGTLKALPQIVAAIVHGMRKKYEKAIVACEYALRNTPTNTSVLKMIVKYANELDDGLELACWQRGEIIAKFEPDNVGLLIDQAYGLLDLARYDNARQLLDRVQQIDPGYDIEPVKRLFAAEQSAQVYQDGADKGARTILENSDSARVLEDESQIARTDDMRRRKIAAYVKELEKRPEDHRILMRIGNEWFDLENFDEGYVKAKEAFEQAHKLMGSDHSVMARLGDLEIKRLRTEMRAAKRAFDAKPEDASLKAAYADSYRTLKTFQIKEYEQRVRAQPTITTYRNELGKLYLETKQYDKAMAELQHACKDPKIALEAYTAMGQCFVATNKPDLGVEMYQRAIHGQEIFTKIKDTVYMMAQAKDMLGDKEEALKLFTQIMQEDILYKDVRDRVESLRQQTRKK